MQSPKTTQNLWGKTKTFSMLALLALFLLFIFQNIQQVEVSFLFWTISTPRALLLFAALSIGIIIGYLLAQTKRSYSINE